MGQKTFGAFILLLLFVNNMTPTTLCVDNLDPDKKQQIDDFVNSLLFDCDKHKIAGMNLAVVYQGETIYTTGYGLKDLDFPDPVTENTMFSLASITKHFTTTLLGQKLKDNGYTWDTPVREILSDLGTDFYFYDPLRTNRTTLRDLAAHSAGILRHDVIWMQNMTRAEQASRIRFLEGSSEPRTDFNYNNILYTLLGHISELLTGVDWEQLVKADIYDKLGMENSTFDTVVPEQTADVASLYMVDGDALRRVEWEANVAVSGDDAAPAGAIFTTANDMAQWMKMLLADGRNEAGEEVFSSDVIAETRLPVNAYSAINPKFDPFLPPKVPVRFEKGSYCLGLGIGSYRGFRFVEHGGAAFGHYSQMILYPDTKLGIYTSISGVEGGYGALVPISMFLADTILDIQPWLNSSSACTFPEPFFNDRDTDHRSTVINKFNIEPRQLNEENSMNLKLSVNRDLNGENFQSKTDRLLGRYGNFAYGNVTIVQDDVTNDIIVQLDVIFCKLILKANNMSYFCEGQDMYWFINFFDLQFEEGSVNARYVDIEFSEAYGENVRFMRDLRMSDAPGPRDHWTICY